MSKLIRVGVVFAALALNAADSDVAGTWKARFTGPVGERPKMVSEMIFELKVEGDRLTGMAHMAKWPGEAEIIEGRVTPDRIWFTVIGKSPASGGSGGSILWTLYPVLHFVATPEGNEMQISLYWGSGRPLEMRAERTAPSGHGSVRAVKPSADSER